LFSALCYATSDTAIAAELMVLPVLNIYAALIIYCQYLTSSLCASFFLSSLLWTEMSLAKSSQAFRRNTIGMVVFMTVATFIVSGLSNQKRRIVGFHVHILALGLVSSSCLDAHKHASYSFFKHGWSWWYHRPQHTHSQYHLQLLTYYTLTVLFSLQDRRVTQCATPTTWPTTSRSTRSSPSRFRTRSRCVHSIICRFSTHYYHAIILLWCGRRCVLSGLQSYAHNFRRSAFLLSSLFHDARSIHLRDRPCSKSTTVRTMTWCALPVRRRRARPRCRLAQSSRESNSEHGA